MKAHNYHSCSLHRQGTGESDSPSRRGHTNTPWWGDHTDHDRNSGANTLKEHGTRSSKSFLIYFFNFLFIYPFYTNKWAEQKKKNEWNRHTEERDVCPCDSHTVSTLRTRNSKKSLFSLNSCVLSNTTNLEPERGPEGPDTENLNTVLHAHTQF